MAKQLESIIPGENNICPTVATPEGKIRAFCSYNCVYVAKIWTRIPSGIA